MPFKPGEQRPEGAGRKAGTPNKRTQQLLDLAKEHDADPFMFLVHVLKGDAKALDTTAIGFHTRLEAAKELMPYLYGKRKPVDSEGSDKSDPLTDLINAIRPE